MAVLVLSVYLCCQNGIRRLRKRVKRAQKLKAMLEEAKDTRETLQDAGDSALDVCDSADKAGGCCGKRSRTLGTEFKILISLVQVLGSLKVVFSIPYPPLYVQVTGWLSLLEFNLFEMMPLGCSFPGAGFHFFLVLRTIGPLVFFAIALTLRWAIKMKKKSSHRRRAHTEANDSCEDCDACNGGNVADRLLTACFFLLFLIYPSNSMKLFTATFCTTVDGEPGATTFLKADLAVNCESDLHLFFANVYAPIFIVVYPILTPSLYAYLIYGVHGKTMRRLNNIAALRKGLRIEASQDILHRHLEERAAGKVSAPLVHDLPEVVQTKLDALEAKEEKLVNDLPDYMRKLLGGYTHKCCWFEIFEYAS